MNKYPNLIYATCHKNFFDKIVIKKRWEILKIINEEIRTNKIQDVLDIGTTSDVSHYSSSFIVKNIEKVKNFKSISDQNISSNFFYKKLKKSIVENLAENEIQEFSSDLVISSATIEHVGNFLNQKKMIKNVIKLSKKEFIITTPYRFHPIEFHTKIPLIHWLPKLIHRKILKFLGLSFYAMEENLNFLDIKDIKKILSDEKITYKLKFIKLLFIKSNIIIIGKK